MSASSSTFAEYRGSECRPTYSRNASSSSKLYGLFNWTTRASGKLKAGNSAYRGPFRQKNKSNIVTWTHTWVCLSSVSDDTVPDSTDRITLQLAGLGEKHFPLDTSATAQEMYDALEFLFPKLKEAGGFELLRASESGAKDPEVVCIPDGGYTIDYLKAVVHNAKLYIRPLQTDLSLEQCSCGSDVSFNFR